ncbi:MAG: hypothetical protein HY648_10495 [Acidobacteria bacterium]|nr:hypothetical protein [Acidobacteriota bacterium]
MADVEWAILCDYAFLDVGRKTCLIGIFSTIFTHAVPATQHQAAIVIKFTGEPNEVVKFRIEVTRPPTAGGGTIASLNGEVKLGESGTSEFSGNIMGLPLPDWGIYAFNIYTDDKPPKIVGFTVAKIPGMQG